MTIKDEDFNQIKTELVSEIKGMRTDMTRLFEKIELHDISLYGNIKANTAGAMDDIRNLKRGDENRQKHSFAIWIAIIPVVLERIWAHTMGHPR